MFLGRLGNGERLPFPWQLMPELITLTLLNATAQGSVVNQYDTTKICLTDKEIIKQIKIRQPYTPILENAFAITSGQAGNGERHRFLLLGHNFLSTEVISIKMCFWVRTLHALFVA